MVQERIDIVVTDRGAEKASRNVKKIGGAADKSQGAVQLLRRALGLLGGAFALRELVRMTDTFTNLQNRLRLVTDTTSQLTAVTEDLFKIARRTRLAFEATTEIYARTALATRQLGVSQFRTLQFTESLNQAIILSGAGAQEARAGMIQLSQGLAAGALRGDELRSVMEQLPFVADVIAKSLGITRGRLREFGEEAKITSGVILKAFEEMREEIAEKFAKTIPTIGQALTVLRNSAIKLVGGFSQATGSGEGLARALLLVADNAEILGRAIGALSIVIGVTFARTAIGAAIRGLAALKVAIAANPLGLLLVALTSVVALFISFGDLIPVTTSKLTRFGDIGAELMGDLEVSLKGVFDVVLLIIPQIRLMIDLLNNVKFGNTFEDFALNLARGLDAIIPALNAFGTTEIFGEGTFGERFMKRFEEELIAAGPGLEDTMGDVFAGATERAIARAMAEGRFFFQDEVTPQDILGEGPIREEAPRSRRITFGDITQRLQAENELLRLNNQEREIQGGLLDASLRLRRELIPVETELLDSLLRTNQALSDEAEILTKVNGPLEEFNRGMTAMIRLVDKGKISLQEATREARELRIAFLDTQITAVAGFERGFLRLEDSVMDLASVTENLLTDAFLGAEDALLEFVRTGKLSFSSLIDSMISDLLRLAIRQALLSIVGAIIPGFGAANGAVFQAPAKVTPFADGGVISSPSLFGFGGGVGIMAEESPEAIMPLARDSQGRLGVRAQDGGGVRIGQVNIDARGAEVGVEERITAAMARFGPAFVAVARRGAKEDVAQLLKRRQL